MKKLSAVMIGVIFVQVALNAAYADSTTYTPLNYPAALDTRASGINNGSAIIGQYTTAC